MMDNLIDKTEQIFGHSKEYVETYVQLQLLKVTEKTAKIGSGIVFGVFGLFFIWFILLFLGIGTGIWIGHLTDSMEIGFFSVAIIFALLIVLLIVLRKKVVTPFIANLIIKTFHGKD